jgi:hypothetical protein
MWKAVASGPTLVRLNQGFGRSKATTFGWEAAKWVHMQACVHGMFLWRFGLVCGPLDPSACA